jgi:hypothetical protein
VWHDEKGGEKYEEVNHGDGPSCGGHHRRFETGTVVFKRQRKSRSTSLLLDRLYLSSISRIMTEWNIDVHLGALVT